MKVPKQLRSLVAILLAWRDTSLEWWWLAGSFVLTFSVGLVISLEMVLSHDAELLRKLGSFARTSQLLIIGWLWGLLYWSFNGLDLYGAEPLLEVVIVSQKRLRRVLTCQHIRLRPGPLVPPKNLQTGSSCASICTLWRARKQFDAVYHLSCVGVWYVVAWENFSMVLKTLRAQKAIYFDIFYLMAQRSADAGARGAFLKGFW